MISAFFWFLDGLGKTSDVGGRFSQELGTTRPSFQHHTPEGQKVSDLKILWHWAGNLAQDQKKNVCKIYSFQILPASDHLEHQRRGFGWEKHHRRGNEWHLRERVRLPVQEASTSHKPSSWVVSAEDLDCLKLFHLIYISPDQDDASCFWREVSNASKN